MYGLKLKNDSSMKNFQGLLQKHKTDTKFVYLKLLEKGNLAGKSRAEL